MPDGNSISYGDFMAGILKRQAELQAEADTIVAILDLQELLSAAGDPVRVGSSALGVMVRRDIDITVVCDRLDASTRRTISETAGELMLDSRIGALRYRNDSGPWNTAPEDYPDGLYLGLTYRSDRHEDWNFDIWFIDEPQRQPDLQHLKLLTPRLTDEIRGTIIAIKTDLAAKASSGKTVPSALVYDAALDHGVSTTAEFEDWLSHRSLQRTGKQP